MQMLLSWYGALQHPPHTTRSLFRHCFCEAGALSGYIRVLTLACDIFLPKFPYRMTPDVRNGCPGSHKMCVRVLGSFWSVGFYVEFSAYSGSREILTCVSTAQARANSASAFRAQSGARHFLLNFCRRRWLV